METIHAYARGQEETQGRALVSTYWEDAALAWTATWPPGACSNRLILTFWPVRQPTRAHGRRSRRVPLHLGSLSLHGRIKLTEQDWRSWLSGGATRSMI